MPKIQDKWWKKWKKGTENIKMMAIDKRRRKNTERRITIKNLLNPPKKLESKTIENRMKNNILQKKWHSQQTTKIIILTVRLNFITAWDQNFMIFYFIFLEFLFEMLLSNREWGMWVSGWNVAITLFYIKFNPPGFFA